MSRHRKPNKPNQQVAAEERGQRRWYKVDLHVHTPASRDYEQPQTTYLDWLRRVVDQGLEIVAITDHNTVGGIAAIRQELEWLTRLEQQGRLTPEEGERLATWRALGDRVLVLPGFEFTATFGFHILGIFPPETPVRQLEHVLLDLKVPPGKLDVGSTETGATTDVLTAYRIIREAGGIVIAAHANSTHGVAMRNFPFGGQTKIAYTQDPNLDALEVTDLDRGGRSTARFFSGIKAEYPRRMHCLQGSDAHRLVMDPKNPKRLGVGERATELLLEEASFAALAALLRSRQFDSVRPARPADLPFDPLDVVREEGPSLVQSFHESASDRSGKLGTVLNDICAFANTAGGAVYLGCRAGKGKIKGIENPAQLEQQIRAALDQRLTPRLEVRFDVVQSQTARVLRVQVPKGPDLPYALDDYKFYVRDEAETSLAVRDEIVALIREAFGFEHVEEEEVAPETATPETAASLLSEGEISDTGEAFTIQGGEAGKSAPVGPVTPPQPSRQQAAAKTAQKTTGAPGEKGAAKSRQKAPAKSGEKPAEKQTEKSPEKPTERSTERSTEKSAEKPAGGGQRRGRQRRGKAQPAAGAEGAPPAPAPLLARISDVTPVIGLTDHADRTFYLPQVGVEIVDSEERSGIVYHTIRDLRNGHTIHNVTRKGARKLWSYAIERCEDHLLDAEAISWRGDVGMIRKELRAGKLRYDLALREDGKVRVFYGVTEDGMEGQWAQFL